MNAAVEAAHRAFQTDWRWRTPAERAALLLEAADVLDEHADELALLESRENGKPVADARLNDINFLMGVFRFFGSLVDKLPTEFYDKGAVYTSTYLEPAGVVGEIIPFNWPPIHAGGKIAPALAVGNTVVLKPSEQAPLTAMRIVELLNTVLPEDVLHAVAGSGERVGRPLVGHPLVRVMAFTGSTGAGAGVAGDAYHDEATGLHGVRRLTLTDADAEARMAYLLDRLEDGPWRQDGLADVRAIMGYAACRQFGVRCPPGRSSWCDRGCFPSGAVGTAGRVGAGDGGGGAAGQRQDGPAAVLDRADGSGRARGVGAGGAG